MTIAFPTALRNTRAQAIQTAIDAGSGPGKLRIYNGTRPSSGGAATTLLAELTMTDPAAPAASGGVLTLSAITQDSSADNSGVATWFRIVDSDGNFVVDGSVGATSSGADLELVTTTIVATQPVQVSSFTFTEGNA